MTFKAQGWDNCVHLGYSSSTRYPYPLTPIKVPNP